MRDVVSLDRAQRLDGLLHGAVREEPTPRRHELADAGVLGHDGPARREVADAPIAEPAAPRPDVDVLRDGELAARGANERAVALGVARDRRRVDERPPGVAETGRHRGIDRVHRQLEATDRVPRQVEEAEEVDVLRPLVRLAPKADVLALVLPGRDGREERRARIGRRGPLLEHDGRPRRVPGEALERDGTVRGAEVLAVGEEHVVAREEAERGLLPERDA